MGKYMKDNEIKDKLKQISLKNKQIDDTNINSWLEQQYLISFLKENKSNDWIILYASFPGLYINTILLPLSEISNIPEQIGSWRCNATNTWCIAGSLHHIGSSLQNLTIQSPAQNWEPEIFHKGEPILFVRQFEGRKLDKKYIEASQKITHPQGLHYVTEEKAFCRFNTEGSLEKVIIIDLDEDENQNNMIVLIKKETLILHMAATNSSLIQLFESFRIPNINAIKKFTKQNKNENQEIIYELGINDDSSYIRGVHIVQFQDENQKIIKDFLGFNPENKSYATFIAHDLKNNKVEELSCDPSTLSNYYELQSSFPNEMSPVFFNPEVLGKYKRNKDKYTVTDRTISCQNAWYLQTYDINDANQVHTYLIYLSALPYNEQLYWKSFNEVPKNGISKRAMQTDFKGIPVNILDPLNELKKFLIDLNNKNVLWWKLRNYNAIDKLQLPVTLLFADWQDEILALHQILMEGFDVKSFRDKATAMNINFTKEEKTVPLLKKILIAKNYSQEEAEGFVSPLSELNKLRQFKAHPESREAQSYYQVIIFKYKNYLNHFKALVENCLNAFQKISDLIMSE